MCVLLSVCMCVHVSARPCVRFHDRQHNLHHILTGILYICGPYLLFIIYNFFILMRNCNPFYAFPAHLHLKIHTYLQIHTPTSSLSSYLPASAKSAVILFRQIVTLRCKPCRYRTNVYGSFGKHPWRPRIARESHNDVTPRKPRRAY